MRQLLFRCRIVICTTGGDDEHRQAKLRPHGEPDAHRRFRVDVVGVLRLRHHENRDLPRLVGSALGRGMGLEIDKYKQYGCIFKNGRFLLGCARQALLLTTAKYFTGEEATYFRISNKFLQIYNSKLANKMSNSSFLFVSCLS